MHSEYFEMNEESAKILNLAKKEKRRIIAIGTTSVRTIEAVYDKYGEFRATKENTSIFIEPGYKYKAVDALITNFHLPKSTLIMLVSAFMGRKFTLECYKHGGIVFGPTGEQNYKIKQNKKEHLLAMKSALSLLTKKGLVVVDGLKVDGKTKEIITVLNALKVNENKVIIVSEDIKVLLGSKNITNVITRVYNNLSVYDLLNCEKLIISVDDVKKLEEELA